MRVVMVMFDSLNRRMLTPYGCDWTHVPNFERLARRSVTFDNCYGGSMPCMPARREMHTGRYNFLHRSWGPLEPFDDSVPEMLKQNGVYTHLVTDHQHYWEDGGATYHNRYSTYEFFRGQEGDHWKGHVADPEIPEDLKELKHGLWRQDWINRQYMQDEQDHPQTLTFNAGLEFMQTNLEADRWFLQIETFDPHEPFFSYEQHKRHYKHEYDGPHYDWPDVKKVTEAPEVLDHVRNEYAALMSFCDASLGRVLDFFDEHDMWNDTMLIVCTDHGFLLGEHGWFGKNAQPWYDETIHTPLFMWDPRVRIADERRQALVQTIDFGPTLLDFFGVDPTGDMQGRSLAQTMQSDAPVRDGALFGLFGGHVCVTDGRWVYMRACHDPGNRPLHEHTLMPTAISFRFPVPQLRQSELHPGFSFTKGVPVLRMPANSWLNPYQWGSLLFDLETDPDQESPLIDDDEELRLATLMRDLMLESDAPTEQYQRLGLPDSGSLGLQHLLVRRQWNQLQEALRPAPNAEDYPHGRCSVHRSVRELLADPVGREILIRHLPVFGDPMMVGHMGSLTPLQVASHVVGLLPNHVLQSLAEELAAV